MRCLAKPTYLAYGSQEQQGINGWHLEAPLEHFGSVSSRVS
jgi:hypothetical protein